MENFIESLYVPYQNSAVKAVVKDKIMFSVPMGTVSVPGLVTFYSEDFSVLGGQVRISSKQIDAKLDKVVTTATTGRVYAVSPSGENYMQPLSSSPLSVSLVARDNDGNILLPDRQDGDNLAISRKTGDGRYVAKKPHTTGKTEVYIQTDSGISTKEVGDTAGDVPVRNVNGNITGYSPLTDNEYTTKSYVNSSIANEAADYISNNGEPFTSLEELQEYTKIHTVTNNDYAIIVVTDDDGNTRYDRYKYNESTGVWGFEYSINNSSFTEAQWAAINSGLTSAKLATMLTEIDNLMAQSLMSVDEVVAPYGESTVTYDTTDGTILHGALAVKTNDGNYWNIPLTFSLPIVAGDGLVVDIKPDNKKMTIKIDYEKVMKMPALDVQNLESAVAVGKWTSGTSSTKVPDAIQWRDFRKNVENNAMVQRTETGNSLLPDGFPADSGGGIDQYGNSIDNMATPKSYVDNAVANAGSKQTVVRIKTSNMFDGSITDTKITGTLDADTLSAIQGDNVVINFVFSNNSGGDSVNVCFGRDRAKEMSTAFAYFGDVIPVNSGTSGLPFSFALRVTLADGAWTLNYAQLYKSVEVDSKVSSATKNMQKTTNMVTSIGSSPSDTKYPSEKAVVDYFAQNPFMKLIDFSALKDTENSQNLTMTITSAVFVDIINNLKNRYVKTGMVHDHERIFSPDNNKEFCLFWPNCLTYDENDGSQTTDVVAHFVGGHNGKFYEVQVSGSSASVGAWTNTKATLVELDAYLDKPENTGTVGQVLAKTETGSQWVDSVTVQVVNIDSSATATNGTLTAAQLATLQASDQNYIMFNNEKYYLGDKGHQEGFLTYSHVGYENGSHFLKSITITISTLAWVLNTTECASKSYVETYVNSLNGNEVSY